jgi:hypothetical protein
VGFESIYTKGGEWPEVEERIVAYIENNVVGKPWTDHLSLAALVMTARRRQANTVYTMLKRIAPRLADLFAAMGYESMQDWNPTEAFKAYLRVEVLPDHTDNMRARFWKDYSSASKQVRLWLKSLPTKEQEVYRHFALPVPDLGELYEIKKLGSQVQQDAKKKRKTATDAIVPILPAIRAKSQLRLNWLTRVRQAYHDALKELQSGKYTLPFSYFYDEGDPPQVLAHKNHYSANSLRAVRSKTGSDENNGGFLCRL